jgi:hypothetical protein
MTDRQTATQPDKQTGKQAGRQQPEKRIEVIASRLNALLFLSTFLMTPPVY